MDIGSNIAACVRAYLSDLESTADDHVVEWLAGGCYAHLTAQHAGKFTKVVAGSFFQVS